MTILDGLFILVSFIWISEFLLFRNRGVGKGDSLETRSFLLIFTALFFTIIAALTLQEFREIVSLVVPMKAAGIILFSIGVFLRFWGITHLKAQFTRHVTVREGDEIVSSGPYKRLRHPLYTGLLFIAVGMALYFTSLIAAVIGGLLTGWMLLKRLRYEEKLLIGKFGTDYEEWMSHRARLLPFIY
ncbi:methyltransferase family protein [Jeotgalibacillus campisalis]|nr:isoprenylcysteine carboxylmethyltransferase family protein [Jeotgalibacillus campisalis]